MLQRHQLLQSSTMVQHLLLHVGKEEGANYTLREKISIGLLCYSSQMLII